MRAAGGRVVQMEQGRALPAGWVVVWPRRAEWLAWRSRLARGRERRLETGDWKELAGWYMVVCLTGGRKNHKEKEGWLAGLDGKSMSEGGLGYLVDLGSGTSYRNSRT